MTVPSRVVSTVPQGLAIARVIRTLALAKKAGVSAVEIAERFPRRWPLPFRGTRRRLLRREHP